MYFLQLLNTKSIASRAYIFFSLLDFYNMTLAYVETKFELSKWTSIKASHTPHHKGNL